MKQISIAEIKTFDRFSKEKTPQEINDVRTSHLTDDMTSENQQVLERARMCYASLSDFRERRGRAFNYYRGNQWGDLIEDDDGELITEEEYIQNRGQIASKQNIIRQLIRNIIGQMLTNVSKSVVNATKESDATLSEMLTNTLQSIQKLNRINVIDARNFEEFLCSGMMVSKSVYKYWNTRDKEDVFTENVSPDYMFFNTDIKDPRTFDLRLIGQLIDMPLDNVIASFATNEEDAKRIKSWYTSVSPKNIAINTGDMGRAKMSNLDFYIPSSIDMARVIEVWEKVVDYRVYAHDKFTGSYSIVDMTLEEIAILNEDRKEKAALAGMPEEKIESILIDADKRYEQFWVVKYLTPFGQCLFQTETPYKHQGTPYTLTVYPLIDGEIWGLVEDIIDQQRNINHLISKLDFIMGAAAKGVLLVPEDCIPDDMDIDDFAAEWTKSNGIIKFKSKPGVPVPQQVNSSVANIGAQDMLAMQVKLVNEISGVSEAIQGHTPSSGTPSSLYHAEAANSSTNMKDIMNVYANHKNERDTKMLKLAMQYYDEKRFVGVSGNRYSEEAKYYDPEKIVDFDFDLMISEGADTPVFRQIISDQLFELLKMNKIDVKMFLENAGVPYADKLLESLNNAESQQMSPEAANIMQQLQQRQLSQEDAQGNITGRTRIQ